MILCLTIEVLLLLISGTGPILCDEFSERFIFDPLSNMTTYITAEFTVDHMEMDLYIDGNLLFSDGSSLKTTDGETTQIVAGNARDMAYNEGVGEAARFREIKGFYQMSSRKVVVADLGNNCLRVIDRLNGQSELLAGNCTEDRSYDGSDALFSSPTKVIADNQDQSKLFVTDRDNKAVRHVDSTTGVTATFYQDTELSYLSGITQDTQTGALYLTSSSTVYKLGYHDKTLTIIAGSEEARGYSDGNFSVSQFRNLRELLFVDNGEQIVITDLSNSRLRVLDMVSNTTSSICSGARRNTDGDMDSCAISYPSSLLVSGDSLYIGADMRIRHLAGRIHATNSPAMVSTAEMSVCARGNVTKQLPPGEKTVDVEMGRGQKSRLPAGDHMFMLRSELENCTIHVSVIAGSGLSSTEIVAIVVAVLAVIAFLVTLALLIVKMRKQRKDNATEMQ